MTRKIAIGVFALVVFLLFGTVGHSGQAAGGKGTTERFTAEEIARMPVEQLRQVVDPALLQRVPVERIAEMSPEELECIMKVKRDYPLSVDFSPEQLARMSEEELSRVVPKRYVEKYGLKVLASMSPDELAHAIPTNLWLNLRQKAVVNVVENLVLVAPDGKVYRNPAEFSAQEVADAAPWVIVLAPHPDDETYGIAGKTNQLYRSGWNVCEVLCTHGEASDYYWVGYYNGWWSSRIEFGNLRVDEWNDATLQIAPTVFRFRYNCGDGDLTITEAIDIVEYVNAYVGGASLVFGSEGWPYETHPDHEALAEGLLQSSVADQLKRWYCVYSDWPDLPPYTINYMLGTQDRSAKNAALQEYRQNSPYAIGYNSTPSIWEREYDDDAEYYTYLP